jgi:hypothetical protein
MRPEAAAQLQGMMTASRALMQGIADFVRENVPDAQRRDVMLKIGAAMAELCDISRMIYDEHPALNPYAEEDRIARDLRAAADPGKAKG